MKVIDLLQRIANKKDIPKVIKILDNTLLPDFRILEWNKDLELYEYIDKTEFNCVLDKYHLNLEVDIIEDAPKEDKKIEHLKYMGEIVKETYSKLIRDEYNRLVLAVDYDKMQKIIDNLQQRIDKAIEYIEDNMSYVVKGNKEYIPTGEDLLDILRGEENE